MSTVTTRSTKQSEMLAIGEFRALGPPQNFVGDEIIVMRCAETIDEIFPDWQARSNLSNDHYKPFDVNTPIELPRRAQMRKSYEVDPPVTEIAKVSSKMIGRELCERKFIPSVIFCSPDFASIETAQLIKKFIGPKCGNIRIEPELSTMYAASHLFFTKDQLVNMGYGIDEKFPALKKISDKVAVPDSFNRVKRAFYELTETVPNALVIVDPLAMRFLGSMFHHTKFKPNTTLDYEKKQALGTYPALSNFTAFKVGEAGVRMYDLSDVTLRPLNYTGFSNDIDFE